MTQRIRLDHFLLEHAAARGADVREGVHVDAVETDERGATVTVNGERLEAAVVIGADGANGTTARAVGLAGDIDWGVAYEGNVAGPELRYRHRAVVELGAVAGGYGWVFPKGDHVNVGVGGWLREGPRLKAHLQRVARAHGLEEVTELRGHRLPMRRPSSPLARGRALLVGDAAGLVDPLSGDGMYECFVSARLASAAVLDVLSGESESLDPYATALTRELAHHLAASWGVKVAIDRYPRAVFAILRVPGVFGAIERILRGELSHPGAARGPVRAPLRALALLARAAGSPGDTYKTEALV
jgi:flavin-dependent dehydrogenase